jgi:hypothetical protein
MQLPLQQALLVDPLVVQLVEVTLEAVEAAHLVRAKQ